MSAERRWFFCLRTREAPAILRQVRPKGPGGVVELWPDVFEAGLYWLSPETRALLDACGVKVPYLYKVDEVAVPLFGVERYPGNPADLPAPDSVRTRTLAGHGIGVEFVQALREGDTPEAEPTAPTDAVFFLRRPGGQVNFLWRLFRSRADAAHQVARRRPGDARFAAWLEQLAVEEFSGLLVPA
jgi:hypothetical protein